MKKSASEDDVFSAVGGLEMGRHDAGVYLNQGAGGSFASLPSLQTGVPLRSSMEAQQVAAASMGVAGHGMSPMIGDLPYSDTPSRTLIVRNVSAACSDQDLHQLFEVCPDRFPVLLPSPSLVSPRGCSARVLHS